MEKKVAGILGAVASLGALTAAHAAPAPTDVLQANSYAELLEPISNASVKLQALDEAAPAAEEKNVQLAQFFYHHHHHHHHHHRFFRRYGPVVVVPGFRHHHHHHHHHHYRRYYRY